MTSMIGRKLATTVRAAHCCNALYFDIGAKLAKSMMRRGHLLLGSLDAPQQSLRVIAMQQAIP
jgi:hypothetical protein